METVTYSPAEFAAIFGKERTWAYRQLYAGKVQAVTGLGRTLIPKSEVDRLLKEAGRYLGAQAKAKKSAPVPPPELPKPVRNGNQWAAAIARRKQKTATTDLNSGTGEKSTDGKLKGADTAAPSRQAALERLSGRKIQPSPKKRAADKL